MSVEDLTFDIKRLTTRLEILQNENTTLEKELYISKQASSEPSKEYVQEFERTRESLYLARSVIVKLEEKYELVKSHLNLERISLSAIRSQVTLNISELQECHKANITVLVDKILYLQEYLEKVSKQFDSVLEKKRSESKADQDTILTLKSTITDREMKTIKLSKDLNTLQSQSEQKISEMQANLAASTASFQDLLAHKDAELLTLKQTNEMIADSMASNISQMGARATQLSELEAKLAELTAMNNSLIATTSTVSNKLHTSQVALKEMTSANEALKLSLLDAETKVQRAMKLNDSLQGDMKALLNREQSLRSEIGSTNLDKQEVYSRLASITAKLKSIEDDHRAEVDQLQDTIGRLQREAAAAGGASAQYKTVHDELQVYTSELKATIHKKDAELAALTASQAAVVQDMYKLKSEISKLTAECSSLGAGQETLRAERGEAQDQRKLVELELRETRSKLEKSTAALRETEKAKQSIETQLSQCNPQLVPQLEDALRAMKQQQREDRVEREREVESLKDTIRRECEERIELLMEIDDLKGQLLRWAGGGGGAKRGSADAGHQTHQSQGGGVPLVSRTADGRSSGSHKHQTPIPMDSSNSSYSMGIVDSLDQTLSGKHADGTGLESSEERLANQNWSEKMQKSSAALALNSKRHKRK